jgi:hypothetical protein
VGCLLCTSVATEEGYPYLFSRKKVKDDDEPTTECAKPDPLKKLFDPLQFPERRNFPESVIEQV